MGIVKRHRQMQGARRAPRTIWSLRRWIFAAWLAFAVTRIPARTGNFRITDVAADILGALIVAGIGIGAMVVHRHISARPNMGSRKGS